MQKVGQSPEGGGGSKKLPFCYDKQYICHSARGGGGMKFLFFRVTYFLHGPFACSSVTSPVIFFVCKINFKDPHWGILPHASEITGNKPRPALGF